MQANHQLHFLQQKVQELGHALLFNLSDSVLKFPTALVSNPQLDEYGYIWFWVQKPKQDIAAFENGFPVRLDFYRKGALSYLQVSGSAWIVTDPEEILAISQLAALPVHTDRVLLKVKMEGADYQECEGAHTHSWWNVRKQNLFSWFRHSAGGYAAADSNFSVS
ncbi:hypothetical protein SAMN05444008_114112 [Cnuella takakiae]|uniref:General stress protein 26 n=1 Tax=Cnuella takakiae TaxID=1302690 RepID=A0A1M5FQA2_9BACT|nr:hypothetical protein [Cnuella takakiae]OLY93674.1 hypothetical protein BUE76_18650 [Cnuella takakiae]SHF93730.1 hypothetical protein SAMN05444008_114112 [Cnuella takakiae]